MFIVCFCSGEREGCAWREEEVRWWERLVRAVVPLRSSAKTDGDSPKRCARRASALSSSRPRSL